MPGTGRDPAKKSRTWPSACPRSVPGRQRSPVRCARQAHRPGDRPAALPRLLGPGRVGRRTRWSPFRADCRASQSRASGTPSSARRRPPAPPFGALYAYRLLLRLSRGARRRREPAAPRRLRLRPGLRHRGAGGQHVSARRLLAHLCCPWSRPGRSVRWPSSCCSGLHPLPLARASHVRKVWLATRAGPVVGLLVPQLFGTFTAAAVHPGGDRPEGRLRCRGAYDSEALQGHRPPAARRDPPVPGRLEPEPVGRRGSRGRRPGHRLTPPSGGAPGRRRRPRSPGCVDGVTLCGSWPTRSGEPAEVIRDRPVAREPGPATASGHGDRLPAVAASPAVCGRCNAGPQGLPR